jgi:hypothetical protein
MWRRGVRELYQFRKNEMEFEVSFFDTYFHPDGKCYEYKITLNNEPLTKDKIFWYQQGNNHFHLGYIGFVDKYQKKGILKNYIHPHCIKYLSQKGIKSISLKPLVKALSLWIYLGFEFCKEFEEIRAKVTFLNYLKSKKIISDEEIEKFDKLSLKEIIIEFKNIFKNSDFPQFVEKKLYYTTLKKEL